MFCISFRVLDEYDRIVATLTPDVLRPKSVHLRVQDNGASNEFFVELINPGNVRVDDELPEAPDIDDPNLTVFNSMQPEENIDYVHNVHQYPEGKIFGFNLYL